ncbi:MAG: hypothetical protein MJ240_10220 [Kiritimatiellae bacterium]|nr:hypothetical protein [Kiritimatiellia bacterium]
MANMTLVGTHAGVGLCLVFSAFFMTARADKSAIWDASASPATLADGALSFTYENAAIKKLSVRPANEIITLSGDSLAFAPDARIDMAGAGKLVLDTGATFPGALTCDAVNAKNFSWSLGRPLWRDEVVEIAELQGVDLSQYRVTGTLFNSCGYDPNRCQIGGEGVAYYQVCSNFEGRVYLDFQLQTQDAKETWLKCVKVRLVEDGGVVTVQALWAKYADRKRYDPGIDFENPGSAVINSHGVTSQNGGGYTIDQLNIVTLAQPEETQVVFRQPVDLAGKLTLTNAVTLLVDNSQGAFTAGVSLANNLDLWAGKLQFLDQDTVQLSGRIGGAKGGIAVMSRTTAAEDGAGLVRAYQDETSGVNEILDKNWHVLLRNTALSCITNVTCLLAGENIGNRPLEADTCHFANDGVTATAQMQNWASRTGDNAPGIIKCVTMELRQQGRDVEIRMPNAYYIYKVASTGYKFPGAGTTGYIPQYHMTNVLVYLDKEMTVGTSLVLSGANACEGGSIVIGEPGDMRPYVVEIAHEDAFPTNGVVDLYGPSVMRLTHGKSLASSGTGWSATLALHEDATLDLPTVFLCGARGPKIVLDGGRINEVNINYLNNLVLLGGSVTGVTLFPGYGYFKEAVWQVSGTEPSCCTATEIRTGSSKTLGTWVLDVEDVTGDEAADLVLDAPITRNTNTSSYPSARVVKRGAGTLKVLKPITPQLEVLSVEDGLMELAANGVLTAENVLTLAGGGIAVDAGLSSAIGVLTLAGDSAVEVQSGASLTFASSAEKPWQGTLSITGDRNAVRFGTAATALTEAQQRCLWLNGSRAKLDKNGYVVPLSGMCVSFR